MEYSDQTGRNRSLEDIRRSRQRTPHLHTSENIGQTPADVVEQIRQNPVTQEINNLMTEGPGILNRFITGNDEDRDDEETEVERIQIDDYETFEEYERAVEEARERDGNTYDNEPVRVAADDAETIFSNLECANSNSPVSHFYPAFKKIDSESRKFFVKDINIKTYSYDLETSAQLYPEKEITQGFDETVSLLMSALENGLYYLLYALEKDNRIGINHYFTMDQFIARSLGLNMHYYDEPDHLFTNTPGNAFLPKDEAHSIDSKKPYKVSLLFLAPLFSVISYDEVLAYLKRAQEENEKELMEQYNNDNMVRRLHRHTTGMLETHTIKKKHLNSGVSGDIVRIVHSDAAYLTEEVPTPVLHDWEENNEYGVTLNGTDNLNKGYDLLFPREEKLSGEDSVSVTFVSRKNFLKALRKIITERFEWDLTKDRNLDPGYLFRLRKPFSLESSSFRLDEVIGNSKLQTLREVEEHFIELGNQYEGTDSGSNLFSKSDQLRHTSICYYDNLIGTLSWINNGTVDDEKPEHSRISTGKELEDKITQLFGHDQPSECISLNLESLYQLTMSKTDLEEDESKRASLTYNKIRGKFNYIKEAVKDNIRDIAEVEQDVLNVPWCSHFLQHHRLLLHDKNSNESDTEFYKRFYRGRNNDNIQQTLYSVTGIWTLFFYARYLFDEIVQRGKEQDIDEDVLQNYHDILNSYTKGFFSLFDPHVHLVEDSNSIGVMDFNPLQPEYENENVGGSEHTIPLREFFKRFTMPGINYFDTDNFQRVSMPREMICPLYNLFMIKGAKDFLNNKDHLPKDSYPSYFVNLAQILSGENLEEYKRKDRSHTAAKGLQSLYSLLSDQVENEHRTLFHQQPSLLTKKTVDQEVVNRNLVRETLKSYKEYKGVIQKVSKRLGESLIRTDGMDITPFIHSTLKKKVYRTLFSFYKRLDKTGFMLTPHIILHSIHLEENKENQEQTLRVMIGLFVSEIPFRNQIGREGENAIQIDQNFGYRSGNHAFHAFQRRQALRAEVGIVQLDKSVESYESQLHSALPRWLNGHIRNFDRASRGARPFTNKISIEIPIGKLDDNTKVRAVRLPINEAPGWSDSISWENMMVFTEGDQAVTDLYNGLTHPSEAINMIEYRNRANEDSKNRKTQKKNAAYYLELEKYVWEIADRLNKGAPVKMDGDVNSLIEEYLDALRYHITPNTGEVEDFQYNKLLKILSDNGKKANRRKAYLYPNSTNTLNTYSTRVDTSSTIDTSDIPTVTTRSTDQDLDNFTRRAQHIQQNYTAEQEYRYRVAIEEGILDVQDETDIWDIIPTYGFLKILLAVSSRADNGEFVEETSLALIMRYEGADHWYAQIQEVAWSDERNGYIPMSDSIERHFGVPGAVHDSIVALQDDNAVNRIHYRDVHIRNEVIRTVRAWFDRHGWVPIEQANAVIDTGDIRNSIVDNARPGEPEFLFPSGN